MKELMILVLNILLIRHYTKDHLTSHWRIIWIVSSANIVSGGLNYLSAPKLLLFNPNTNQVVDSDSFVAIVPEQSIAEVEIAAPVKFKQ